MKILVKAKPGSKKEYIREEFQGLFENGGAAEKAAKPVRKFVVAVAERAVEGRANEAIVVALADYFKVSRSGIRLVSGARSKEKIFEIFGK